MGNLKEMFTSKKFKVTLFTVLGIVCSALADKITWTQAGSAIIPIVMTYLVAQGIADVGVYLGGAKTPDTPTPTPTPTDPPIPPPTQ
jgi:hypothetical protein